ncbi:MAG: UDP-N-acetylmuramate--L-alanine ligase [Anaerorhabdus sp.]|uniref:UDP-N-acetylmuramate--L-alanine ligase n=1 Tax=Anaerorhabdus sp. TaxID=1872524 RepID=UPI002FCB24A1
MIYFIGIKGTGMAALACILHDLGEEVSGSDLAKHFFTEEPLIARNIRIDEFNKDNIKDGMTVIIGNAFKEDFEEVVAARQNPTITCYRYHEYLGLLMSHYKSISVAGSHGKTTTTGMLAAMMDNAFPTGFLIGDGTGVIHPDSQYLCVESCEYRRHFLAYKPDYAIITNVEIDHVDYFKTEDDYRHAYEEFSNNVKKALMIFGDDEEARKCELHCQHYWYGENENNDLRAINITESTKHMEFDVYFLGEFMYHFDLPFVGRHLLWNSLAVIGIGILEGLSCEQIEKGLKTFRGVKRRFVVEEVGNNIFIDDYAHHPTEVSITIDAARKRYPDKKLISIFKPHRVSRVFHFADQFANALKKSDEVYLCDFTSIDDKEDGIDIDIHYLQEKIPGSKILTEDEEGAKILAKEEPAVYLFMSSKDIYDLANIVKRYQNS